MKHCLPSPRCSSGLIQVHKGLQHRAEVTQPRKRITVNLPQGGIHKGSWRLCLYWPRMLMLPGTYGVLDLFHQMSFERRL